MITETTSTAMDIQSLFNSVVSIIAIILGWFARELWSAVKDLKNDLSLLREDLPKNYVARDDYRNDLAEIKSMLIKIFDKLETKKDKE